MPQMLPTEGQRPRLTKAEVAALMEDVAYCANMDPLSLPKEIASAYRKGVPLTTLSRWFGVPVTVMRDYVNVQLKGSNELAKNKRAAMYPPAHAKPAATRRVTE
jgi:hypothetical protein